MLSPWPKYQEEYHLPVEESKVETIKEAVRNIRNVRSSMNVPPSKKALIYVVTENEEIAKIFDESKHFFSMLALASDVIIQKDKSGIDDDAVSAVIAGASFYMPFAELWILKRKLNA